MPIDPGTATLLVGGMSTAAQMWGQSKANDFNAGQAQRQMDWQQFMSNTAHQREGRDLEKAGLNRLLSMNGSGASTPTGAMAVAKNEMEGAAASAQETVRMFYDMKKQKEEIELLRAQRNKTNTEEKVIRGGIPESEMKNDIFDAIKGWWNKASEATKSSSFQQSEYVRKKHQEFDKKHNPNAHQRPFINLNP